MRDLHSLYHPHKHGKTFQNKGKYFIISLMSKRSRRALFYVLCAIFLLLGVGVVLFAQGFRMDIPSFRVSKVGGIYVRSYPENASIFLNGKPVKNQSGFLSRGTLISDLFPKTYRLALTAPGYDDWYENTAVAPSLVANHEYAVLVPANATSAATGIVSAFAVNNADIVTETSGGEILLNGKKIGSGDLVDAESGMPSTVFRTATGTYELLDASDGTVTNLSSILSEEVVAANAPLAFFLDPSMNSTVVAVSQRRIWLLDASQRSGKLIGLAPRGETIAPSVAVSPDRIAWARSARTSVSSTLVFYDRSSGIVASTTVAIGGPVKKMSWISSNALGLLASGNALYLYDTNQRALKKIADEVRAFSATADGMRIAASESGSLEIFTLNDPTGYYRFNLPDVGDISATFWYRDGEHLFVAYPDHVAFLDIKDVSLTNFTTVSYGTSPKYDPQANALYLMNPQGRLIRFDFPK